MVAHLRGPQQAGAGRALLGGRDGVGHGLSVAGAAAAIAALASDGQPVVLAVLPRLLQALRGQRLRSVPLNEAFKGGEAVCPLDKVAA